MRALSATCALIVLLAVPLAAQTTAPRFLKVDVTSKNGLGHLKAENGPTEVHLRMPLSLAKGMLEMALDGHVKIEGKGKGQVNVAQLLKLADTAKAGDMLLEVTTNTGDLVKIVIE